MSDLRLKMLPVLDGAVESGALTRDEAISVLDHICSPDRDFPDREYAERLMRSYWRQRPEGRAMSETAWVPTTETDRMVAALHEAGAPPARHAMTAAAEDIARAVKSMTERGER